MKLHPILLFALLASSTWWPATLQAQFTTTDNQAIEVCDCRKRIDNLNVTIDIPEEVKNYDIIGFQLVQQGNILGTSSYYTSHLPESKSMTFNIFNPENQGERSIFGMHSALYQSDIFRFASYSSICSGKEPTKLYLLIYGVKQEGTETTYQLMSNGTIVGRTEKLYGNAKTLATTNELPVIPLGIRPKTRLASVAYLGFAGAGVGVFFLLKSTLGKMGL